MANILTLNPPPGPYSDPQTVTVTGPAGYTILATDNGKDPVVVKTIASTNKLGPEYPYIQAVDDGRGRVVLDGAFSKYYNQEYSADPTTAANRTLLNALNFLNKNTTKRLLVLGDSTTAYSYAVKGSANSSFISVFNNIPQTQDYTVAIRDSGDYTAGSFTPTYAECMQYDVIFLMSSSGSGIPASMFLSTQGAANIAAARKQGVGIYICTDNIPFYESANILLAAITDAAFVGNYDFSPGTTVAYNKAKYGDSPLFLGMADTDVLHASTSDSYVNQVVTVPESLPKTINVPVGFTSLKFAVVDPSGNITFEEYGYSAAVTPIIELCESDGTIITEIPASKAKNKFIYFKFVPTGSVTSVSGFIKAGSTVIGTFNGETGGILNVEWLDTDFSQEANPNEITMPRLLNRDIHVELFDPLAFIYTWSFNRIIPSLENGTVSEVLSTINDALELSVVSSPAQTFKVVKTMSPSFTVEPSFAKTYRKAYTAMVEDI